MHLLGTEARELFFGVEPSISCSFPSHLLSFGHSLNWVMNAVMQTSDQDRGTTTYTVDSTSANSNVNPLHCLVMVSSSTCPLQTFDQDRNATAYTTQLTSTNSSLTHLTWLSLKVSKAALASELISMSHDRFQALDEASIPQLPSGLHRIWDSPGSQDSLVWRDVRLHSGQATLTVSLAIVINSDI